jgi:hypothetical protein
MQRPVPRPQRPARRLAAALALALALAALARPPAPARAFSSPENVVVLRAGDGVTPISAAAARVSLLEYTAAGALVGSVDLPAADSGANQTLTVSGSATAEGGLARSPDGRYLTLAGYDAPPGTPSVNATTSALVPRVVARVSASGLVDTSTTLSAYSSLSIRGALTTNGLDLWTFGSGSASSGGLGHVAFGSVGAAPTQITALPANVRSAGVYGGQLYISSAAGAFNGVSSVGAGVPTAAGQPSTLLMGSTASGPSPTEFVLVDADGNGAVERAYVADDRSAPNGGIQRWDFDGAAWALAYTITSPGGVRGLGAFVARPGGAVTLYATTSTPTANNSLVRIVDTGAASAPTTIASAGANYVFRGVAMAPGATPTPVALAELAAKAAPAGGVALHWRSETEYGLAGYHVLRSATGRRADAERLTAAPIPAAGDGLTGAAYTWTDPGGSPGASYWLQALDRDGAVAEHGPVQAAAPSAPAAGHRVFIPLARP